MTGKFKLTSDHLLAQAMRYYTVGACALAIDLAVFQLLVALGLRAAIAAACSYVPAACVHFVANRAWSFRAYHRTAVAQARTYLLVLGTSWCATVAVVAVCNEGFHLGALLSKGVAVAVTLPMGFLGHKYVTFGGGLRATLRRVERTQLLLGAVVAIAIALRLPSLVNDGLWRDQANVYVQVSAPSFGAFFARVIATEYHPPLFFAIAWLWARIAGTGEWAFLFLPFVFSVATVPVVYRLGCVVASRTVGIGAALVFALSPIALTYSTEYLYPLLMLLGTALVLVVARARSEPLTPLRVGACALFAALVVYTHYAGLFVVAAAIAWALRSPRGVKHGVVPAAALAAGAATFALWLPYVVDQRRIGVPYAQSTSLLEKLRYVWVALLHFVPAWPMLAGVLVLAALAAGTALGWRAMRSSGVLWFAAAFMVLLLATAAANLLVERYVLALYGSLCVFMACAFSTLVKRTAGSSRAVQLAFLFCAAVLVCGDALYAAAASVTPKSGIRTLVRAQPPNRSTLYVLAPDYLASTFAFYTRAGTPPAVRGFVRADAEVFALRGYAADWNDPRMLARAERTIEREARHYRYLELIVDEHAHDQGRVPYAQVWTFVRKVRARFPLLERRRYRGRYESVLEYRFST